MSHSSEQWNYETAVRQVESLIKEIESGELPLEAVFNQFAIAVEQLQQCERFLTQGRQNMELLIETLTDERPFE